MRGIVEASSQPSEPAPLIQASSPLSIPPSVSLKMTILSKYSHCIFSLPSARQRSTKYVPSLQVVGRVSRARGSCRRPAVQRRGPRPASPPRPHSMVLAPQGQGGGVTPDEDLAPARRAGKQTVP